MELRNIAIIAHVDHGKTTLVDALLKQSVSFSARGGSASGGKQRPQFDATSDLIMDSNELERERGITIFSKNASVIYKDTKINIVDTPGHADFGGEVERIMRMVDGVLLLVDAKEGPMPQTKFVLRKAIQAGHKIIVVINKIDKPDARPDWALSATFDLFFELGASEEQVEFPVIYAVGKQGKAGLVNDLSTMKDIEPVFETIVKYIPAPKKPETDTLQMLTVNLAYDNYKGKVAIGRLYSGVLRKAEIVGHVNRAGEVKKAELTSVMVFDGLGRVDVDEAYAGDIVAIAGIPDVTIGETITDLANPLPLPTIEIDEPTIKMTFSVNTSPFRGKEGKLTTSRNIKDRLDHELETDVALSVAPTDQNDTSTSLSASSWTVAGRGELHLAILIEKMRREGYELEVSKPQVIFKEKDGKKEEPIELLSVEVPEAYSGTVIEMMGKRLGEMMNMRVDDNKIAFMDFKIPTRGLIGVRNRFLTSTKGAGIMNTIFLGYEPYKGDLSAITRGSIVASEAGVSNNYGLVTAQGRGKLFLSAGVPVYEGMVVGECAKEGDVIVHVAREKQLTNFRAKNEGLADQLEVPVTLSLEDCLDYISDDELVEVTPQSVRIRKKYLNENERNKARKAGNS
jgi:GTP-binding protein